jgi:hypothetical protein
MRSPRTALLLLAVAGCLSSARRPEQALAPGQPGPTPVVRRLTVAQYRNTLTDLLGPGLVFPMLDEEPGTGGFSTTGAAQVTTSFHGVEQYVGAAEVISRQLFIDEARRYGVVGCVPSGPQDQDCARRFLTSFGRATFRRPLTADELDGFLAMAMTTAARRGDFWAGLRVATTAILASPSFIYVVDRGRSPDMHGRVRTTSFELAARLSLFLWNTSPDPLLLEAAARDELVDDAAVRRHVLRMMASPRAREGLRNFFSELYRLDAVERVGRDKEREPKVSVRAIGRTMKEETLRVLEYNTFEDRADFRKLFTSRETFINPDLAKLYRVKIMDGGFSKVVLPEDGPRRGLLGHASFLAGTSSPPEKTSPTARGKWVREVLLCEAVPAPPPNVDTNLPPPEGEFQTLRERLEEHRSDVGCARCHKLIDTIGLAFERFDYYGEYREKEGEHPIDPSGELDGRAFADPSALGALLAADERVPACLMRNLHRYATGRAGGDEAEVKSLTAAFKASGYRLYEALIALATSESFLYLR